MQNGADGPGGLRAGKAFKRAGAPADKKPQVDTETSPESVIRGMLALRVTQ